MAKSPWVRPMFDAIAPRYDLLNRLISFGMDRRWRRRAVAAVLADHPTVIADIGAGTCDLAFEIERQAKRPIRVLALDFSRPMLRRGERRLRANGLSTLAWPVEADALRAPLPDASVDAVISAFVMRNLDSLPAAWNEFARILRPGGRLVVLEMTASRIPLFRHLFRLYFHGWVPWLGRRLSGHASAYAWLPRSIDEFPPAETLAEQMRAAEFEEVEFRRLALGTVALHSARRGGVGNA